MSVWFRRRLWRTRRRNFLRIKFRPISATYTGTLSAFTLSGTVTMQVSAAYSGTLSAFTVSTNVDVIAKAQLATTLSAFTLAGTVDATPSAGDHVLLENTDDILLEDGVSALLLESSGVSGAYAGTIGAFTLSAAADVDVRATLASTLSAFTLSASATITPTASGSHILLESSDDILLEDGTSFLLLEGDGQANASLSASIGTFTLAAAADVDAAATLSVTFGAFTLAGVVDVILDETNCTLGVTIDPVTMTGAADVDVAVTGLAALDAFTLDSAVRIVGTPVPTAGPALPGAGGGKKGRKHNQLAAWELERQQALIESLLETVQDAVKTPTRRKVAEVRKVAARASLMDLLPPIEAPKATNTAEQIRALKALAADLKAMKEAAEAEEDDELFLLFS